MLPPAVFFLQQAENKQVGMEGKHCHLVEKVRYEFKKGEKLQKQL